MALTSILSELCGDIICTNSVERRQAVIAETCAKVQRAWEDVSNRLPWHDFCSTEKEKPVYDVKWFQCSACGDRFMSGRGAKPNYCSHCGNKWQELQPAETVDGILKRFACDMDVSNIAWCLTNAKRCLCDKLVGAFRHGASARYAKVQSDTEWAESILRHELGKEG